MIASASAACLIASSNLPWTIALRVGLTCTFTARLTVSFNLSGQDWNRESLHHTYNLNELDVGSHYFHACIRLHAQPRRQTCRWSLENVDLGRSEGDGALGRLSQRTESGIARRECIAIVYAKEKRNTKVEEAVGEPYGDKKDRDCRTEEGATARDGRGRHLDSRHEWRTRSHARIARLQSDMSLD